MQLKRLARRRLHDPLVVVPLVGALMAVGWVQYSNAGDDVSRAAAGADLIPAVQGADLGGWQADSSRGADVELQMVDGLVTDSALEVTATDYASGDVTLTSPRVEVPADQPLLFKAHTTGVTPFVLLARHFAADGTAELVEVQDGRPLPGSWTTVSDAFDSADTTVAVQYVFRFAGNGTLVVDGAYLERADDVQLEPTSPEGPNMLPDMARRGDEPPPWTSYRSGAATVVFTREQDSRGDYLQTRVWDYVRGEAKWQYPPVAVRPDQYLAFTATYRADRQVDVVAEFEEPGGGRRFVNLATVPPAGDWTTVTEHVQVPDGVESAMVTLVAHGDGATAVRDVSLVDVTRPGPPRWERPLVSITFDDGWDSAYDTAAPLLEERSLPGTFYVNPSSIETRDHMSAAELESLPEAGHQVAVHGYADVDLTARTAGSIDEQLRKGKDSLADAGLPTNDLATPMGRSDPQVEWYARKYFQTVRGMESGINTRQDLDPYDLRVFYAHDGTTTQELAAALAEAERTHGWLIVVYHRVEVVRSEADQSTVTIAELTAQLDVIRRSGIQVRTVSSAFAEINAP